MICSKIAWTSFSTCANAGSTPSERMPSTMDADLSCAASCRCSGALWSRADSLMSLRSLFRSTAFLARTLKPICRGEPEEPGVITTVHSRGPLFSRIPFLKIWEKLPWPRNISCFRNDWRTEGLHRLLFLADGELPASFCPAARQDFPPGLRLHARPEPVLVLPLPIARLKCTLHAWIL